MRVQVTNYGVKISECYFAVKGAALVLPHDECLHVHRKTIANGACDIQQHLQSMLYLLHADDILKMAVKLESIHSGRTRYLVVVYHNSGEYQQEESCLLGIDCNKETTIGLLLPVWADSKITLDGDG
ncbi:UNVERIFIED_CONTAM: Protein phosphatase Slingshot-like protein 2 [Trichonephila clavipes]